VRDAAQRPQDPNQNNPYNVQPVPQSQNELVSSTFDEIPMNVSLTVQFEIVK
jgi:hypothetical protein